MQKIYALLPCLCFGLLLKAQTTNTVNFTFVADPATNKVVFTNTSVFQNTDVKKAFWYFGDSTVAQTGPTAGTTHYYPRAGTYPVCLRVYRYSNTTNDSALVGSECKTVTLQEHCEAGFTPLDTTIAGVHVVTFYGGGSNNSGKPVKQVCWNFGDGSDTCISAMAGATPPLTIVHRYTQPGTYNVCLNVKFDGGCVAEKCNVLALSNPTITDSCAAGFTSAATTASLLRKRFAAQPWHSNGKKPVRICWAFGDGKDTCLQYTASYTGDYWAEHQYTAYGQYEVCATIRYDGGCEKKKCNTIAIIPPDTVCSFDLNEAAVSTASLERKFYVGLMPNAPAQKICWNFGDGTDTCLLLSNPLNAQQLMIAHRYPAPGSYTVCTKVTYANGCTAGRCKPVSITVEHGNVCGGYLTDSAISANTVRFKGTGIQNNGDYVVSYNWTFGDGTTGSGQTVNHAFASPGRYTVCLYLKTNTGCETKICNSIGVSGNNQPQLTLMPNPVVTVLNATFVSLFQQTVTVKIYNANGLTVRSYARAANVGSNNWSFSDVGTLPTGVYSMIVQSTNQFATAIFFKQ